MSVCKFKVPTYNHVLLISGSDVNRQDEDGRTPLMLACASDLDGRSVEYLIKHKADTSVFDNKVRLRPKKKKEI